MSNEKSGLVKTDVSSERNYGIDLLRLVLMFMICIMHTLGQGGVLQSSEKGTLGYNIFWLMETFSFCAVDAFALISGYMAKNRPQKYEKIVEMWFQVFFYSFVLNFILTIAGVNESWDEFDTLEYLFPVTFGQYWYFTAYFALFFAMPLLNKFLFTVDENTSKKAFIILVVMFSVMGTLDDPFKSNKGYSAIWLIVVYCIGVLAKRIKLFEKRSSAFLIIIWAACIIFTWFLNVFMDNDGILSYISPTILFSGIIMVILFSRLNIKWNIIKKLSPLAFGIYLLQLNMVVWTYLIAGCCAWISFVNVVIGVIYVILFALALFISGLAVEYLRSKIAKLLRIHLISQKIVAFADNLMGRLFVFLK